MDRTRLEEKCRALVEGTLGGPNEGQLEELHGKRLRDVRLEGSYPSTRIVVELDDLRPWRRKDRLLISERLWDRPGLIPLPDGIDDIERSIWAAVIEA